LINWIPWRSLFSLSKPGMGIFHSQLGQRITYQLVIRSLFRVLCAVQIAVVVFSEFLEIENVQFFISWNGLNVARQFKLISLFSLHLGTLKAVKYTHHKLASMNAILPSVVKKINKKGWSQFSFILDKFRF